MSTSGRRVDRRYVIIAIPVLLIVSALIGFLGFTALAEREINGVVSDRLTTQPLAGARIGAGGRTAISDERGRFAVVARPGLPLQLEREGYQPTSIVVGLDARIEAILEPYILRGRVTDALTGKPIAGARVEAGGAAAPTGPDGRYSLAGVEPGSPIAVEAPGYRAAELTFEADRPADVKLRPNAARLRVVNAWSGERIADATVDLAGERLAIGSAGEISLERIRQGAELAVGAAGFAPATLTYDGRTELVVELQPEAVGGTVTDAEGRPIAGARVGTATATATTDQAGRFRLTGLSVDAVLQVRKEGYQSAKVDVRQHLDARSGLPLLNVVLEPRSVRALYLTYYGVGSDELLGHALELLERTEANALVVDVKGDRGWLAYPSKIPLVQQIGAQQEIMIPDLAAFVREMKQRDVYLIGRIVTFKDDPLGRARPDLAVRDSRTGGLWIDREGLAWTDAFREEVWDYNIAIAREVAAAGFDEIQFDYIRFPTDASAGTSVDAIAVSQPKTLENRVRAISGFLAKARQALEPLGVALGVDIFGYVCWRTDDMGIGQHLETLAKYVDVISPMVYPTLYWDGIPVVDGPTFATDAPAHPYEIVYQSLKRASARLKAAGASARLRPWLQYYNDYVLDVPYGDREVRLQTRATYDNDIAGWMLWDPSNKYQKGGFEPST